MKKFLPKCDNYAGQSSPEGQDQQGNCLTQLWGLQVRHSKAEFSMLKTGIGIDESKGHLETEVLLCQGGRGQSVPHQAFNGLEKDLHAVVSYKLCLK